MRSSRASPRRDLLLVLCVLLAAFATAATAAATENTSGPASIEAGGVLANSNLATDVAATAIMTGSDYETYSVQLTEEDMFAMGPRPGLANVLSDEINATYAIDGSVVRVPHDAADMTKTRTALEATYATMTRASSTTTLDAATVPRTITVGDYNAASVTTDSATR